MDRNPAQSSRSATIAAMIALISAIILLYLPLLLR
jgi:hypothetical protein